MLSVPISLLIALLSALLFPLLFPVRAAAQPVIAHSSTALASWAVRGSCLALLLVGALAIAAWLLRHRAALVRRSEPSAPDIDAEWLERNVFSLTPELVGAVYDRRIAWPEVAAVVARMSVESKLASRVATGEQGWSNLELWLLVEREELSGYERELIESIFFSGKTTSGDAIREAYRGVGFDPARILRRHIGGACDSLLGARPLFTWPLRAALALGVLGLLLCSSAGLGGVVLSFIAGAVGVVAPLGLVRVAARRRDTPERPLVLAQLSAVTIAASAVLLALLLACWPGLTWLAAVGLAAWGLACAMLVARLVVSKESASGFALRRNLGAARQFFAAELARAEPRIQDEWLPYLIALELKGEVDHWYLAFGRLETAARRERLAQPEAAANENAWTGGAGAYGGIGASGAWIAATTGLTVAVPGRRSPLPQELGYI